MKNINHFTVRVIFLNVTIKPLPRCFTLFVNVKMTERVGFFEDNNVSLLGRSPRTFHRLLGDSFVNTARILNKLQREKN